MRWTIRNQILIPVAGLLLVAVTLTSISAAYLAAARSERAIGERLQRVTETLARTDFPFSQNVLDMMKGLSGAEFLAINQSGAITASTLATEDHSDLSTEEIPLSSDPLSVSELPVMTLNSHRYYAARQQRVGPSAGSESLLILYSEDRLRAAQWEAAWPPIVIGSVTLLAVVLMTFWLSARIGKRIRGVQQQVAHIADGDFRAMSLGRIHDEIYELMVSINRMSEKLKELESTIQQTERSRLLGQLAGGLAHQLRNAVTGAKLAVQIHQRRCQQAEQEESLQVALRELELTEEHVKRLLSVGSTNQHSAHRRGLLEILDDVATLVSPMCQHADVALTVQSRDMQGAVIANAEALRTALINLVLNAVEASGPQGVVTLDAKQLADRILVTVTDDGPGPPAEIQGRLFDPFVTGKPEGVGLGLALVKQMAELLGGTVSWLREDGHTSFQLAFPATEEKTVEATPSEPSPPLPIGANRS